MKMIRFLTTFVMVLVSILAPLFAQPPAQTAAASVPQGTIAYVKENDTTGDEIHLINPDGSSDKKIWSTGKEGNPYLREVHELTWKPDASELAFVSRFQEDCSVFQEDVYAIRPDGSHLRRQTAPPGCNPNRNLPAGTVNLTVDNYATYGTYVVYLEGAVQAQFVTLAKYESKMLTFTGVMDYGDGVPQWAVGIYGEERYSNVYSHVDVLPGKAVSATLALSAMDRTWSSPAYSSDGSEMAYILNPYLIYYGSANSNTPGGVGLRWQPNNLSMAYSPSHLQWIGDDNTGKMLYLGYDFNTYKYGFYQADHTTSTLLAAADMGVVFGMQKLPDNSGLIFSAQQTEYTDIPCVIQRYGNIYQFKFATKTITQITHNTARPQQGDGSCPDGPFYRDLSISPDGKKFAYEYQDQGKWDDQFINLDLWIMNLDGSGATLLVEGGEAPAWSPTDLPVYRHVNLPFITR